MIDNSDIYMLTLQVEVFTLQMCIKFWSENQSQPVLIHFIWHWNLKPRLLELHIWGLLQTLVKSMGHGFWIRPSVCWCTQCKFIHKWPGRHLNCPLSMQKCRHFCVCCSTNLCWYIILMRKCLILSEKYSKGRKSHDLKNFRLGMGFILFKPIYLWYTVHSACWRLFWFFNLSFNQSFIQTKMKYFLGSDIQTVRHMYL